MPRPKTNVIIHITHGEEKFVTRGGKTIRMDHHPYCGPQFCRKIRGQWVAYVKPRKWMWEEYEKWRNEQSGFPGELN